MACKSPGPNPWVWCWGYSNQMYCIFPCTSFVLDIRSGRETRVHDVVRWWGPSCEGNHFGTWNGQAENFPVKR